MLNTNQRNRKQINPSFLMCLTELAIFLKWKMVLGRTVNAIIHCWWHCKLVPTILESITAIMLKSQKCSHANLCYPKGLCRRKIKTLPFSLEKVS